MSKKRILTIAVTSIIIVLSIIVWMIVVPPVWKGASEDGKWVAEYKKDIFMQETGPHRKWYGKLHWKGSSEAELLFLQYRVNGKYDTSIVEPSNPEMIEKEYLFGLYGGQPDPEDVLELEMRWVEHGNEYHDVIQLKRK